MDLAYHSIRRVKDIAEVVFDALTKQQACAGSVQPIVLFEPAKKLGSRMLRRLVERASITHSEDIFRILAPRPANALPFDYPHRELDLHRDLYPGSDDLALPLGRVAVTNVEKGTGYKDGEIGRPARDEPPIVHVTAMLGRGRSRDRLAAGRGNAKAAEHRRQWNRQVTELCLRLDQRGRAALIVDPPLGQLALGQLADIRRIHHVCRHN